MIYKIHEIFSSIQGEGYWVGTPMTFIRLWGCNLKCKFCDTPQPDPHVTGYGRMDFSVDVTEQEILKQVEKYPNQRVCITGGEPLLQDVEPLTHLLSYDNGYTLHLETNGTIAQPLAHIHWVTVSPKNENSRKILRPHEVKLLVPNEDILDEIYFWSDANMGADHKFFQPINYRSRLNRKNVTRCLSLLEDHPGWRLSIQLHKVIGVR